LEAQEESSRIELELPNGLRELSARVSPDPEARRELVLHLDEIGLIGTAWAALDAGPATVAGEVLQVLDGLGTARARPGRIAWALAEGLDAVTYGRWLRTFEVPPPAALERLQAEALGYGLRVSIVTAPRADESELSAQLPGRVEIVRAAAEATGEVLLPLRAGTRLAPHALATVVRIFGRRPDLALVHADDDRLAASGRRAHPDFRPVLGPEILRSRNALRGLVAVRRQEAPPLSALDDATLYGWALACLAQAPPARVSRLPLVLATLDGIARVDEAGEREALARHLDAVGTTADVRPGLAPGLHHVRYRLPEPVPRVTVVVPTRNARELVELCVHSVRSITRYASYEIQLVDNGSDEPDALAAFDALARAGDVVLHRDPRPFNFPALNNAAVARSDAEVLCLLNNDVEALHPEWLEEMVSVAMQPGVGAVGAKLFYPDGRIQHGGVVVGLHASADHAYARAPGDAPGHAQELLARREVSAVTAACLVVRRALYLAVDGLDEDAFPVAFNDVDFCLKLRERGYRNVWTPHARLVHHESASRGKRLAPEQKARAARELAALRTRWAVALLEDPYHSPNLSLSSNVPRLAWPPREPRPWSA
jgi:GT2 family glycosyltransferase